jgi:hypothetical protein
MVKDGLNDLIILDEVDDLDWPAVFRINQRIDFIDLTDEPSPAFSRDCLHTTGFDEVREDVQGGGQSECRPFLLFDAQISLDSQ